MKICHMILTRGFAGSERATAEMCNAHCGEHEVLLIIRRGHANRAGISIRQYVDPRVRVVEVGNWFPRSGIERALAEFQPDVIHAHLRKSTRMLAKIRPAAATVATLHITVNGPHFADMDGIICIADWQHDDLPKDYRGSVYDVNLAFIPHRRLAADEVAALRASLGAAPGDFVVGGVGRLAHSKGWDTLIEAFNRAALPGSRLVIIGEGRERKRLEQLLGPNSALPGFKTNSKDYYQAYDLFVCPSRREPLPYVLLEALDSGVPYAASAVQGNKQVLRDFPGDGFPAEDVDALAAILRRHHAERPPRQQRDLGAFHIDAIAARHLEIYRELADRKRGRA